MSAAKRAVEEIFELADVKLNGPRPWDINVRDDRFYRRALSQGSLGVGESYMDGWWDAEALDEFFTRIHRADLDHKVRSPRIVSLALRSKLLNLQTPSKSRRVAMEHYDLGNDLYEAMLGQHMQYSCAYWKDAQTLDEAQEAKLHLVGRKLKLCPRMRVLELGGGFGGLARFLAREYGCDVVSYNISAEQIRYAREWCKGLPVRFEQKDYRQAAREEERFDRVVAVGICEHIGHRNYDSFFALAHQALKEQGLFLMHSIGGNNPRSSTDAWIDKYIFPNGVLPGIAQLGKAMEGRWVMEDWHNFGPDYDLTLLAWWENFERAWPDLRPKYGDRFYRMWKFYIMSSAGGFRARKMQLWQVVLSKGGIAGYVPVR